MNLLILKTNIKSLDHLESVKPVFDIHNAIKKWTIDQEDIDNVLRIEADQNLQQNEIISILRHHGFKCEALHD